MKKLIIFLIVYTLFAGLFIYNTSTVKNGERYFLLCDDAMISMQYAKNFAEGNGLVWSVGEKVQGFTNPLWTLYMAIPHLLNIPHSKTSLFIQITAYLFMIGTLILIWKMSNNIVTLIFVGFFLPLNYWFYSGMEVSVLTFLCTLVVFLIHTKKSYLLISLICGLMIWIRIDMVLFFILVSCCVEDKKIHDISICCLFLGLLLLWSFLNYGYALPNTYYLKMEHYPLWQRLLRGIATLGINFFTMNWIFFGLIFLTMGRKQTPTVNFIIAFFCIEVLYSIYIGGDAWENQGGTNRFITLAMPLIMLIIINILNITMNNLNIYNKYAKALIVILMFINLNMLMCKPKSFGMYFLPTPQTKSLINTLDIALALKSVPDNTVIATQGAGVLPYFSDKKYYIDLHGKCDKVIAHGKITAINSLYDVFITAPGHVKYNQEYSIKQLKPDIIVHPINDGKIDSYLNENYIEFMKDTWKLKNLL